MSAGPGRPRSAAPATQPARCHGNAAKNNPHTEVGLLLGRRGSTHERRQVWLTFSPQSNYQAPFSFLGWHQNCGGGGMPPPRQWRPCRTEGLVGLKRPPRKNLIGHPNFSCILIAITPNCGTGNLLSYPRRSPPPPNSLYRLTRLALGWLRLNKGKSGMCLTALCGGGDRLKKTGQGEYIWRGW